jgi:glycosyltransferase involved in cell wall biosynthesis
MGMLSLIRKNRVFLSYKNYLKKCLGRHYEPWIRNPVLLMHRYLLVLRGVLRASNKISIRAKSPGARSTPSILLGALRKLKRKNPLKLLAVIARQCQLRIQAYSREPRIAVIARQSQLRIQSYSRKLRIHPLRILVCPFLAVVVRILELRYRRYYAQFGTITASLTASQESRRGVLLISGTLGPGGSERQTVLTTLGLIQRQVDQVNLAVVYLRSEFECFYLHKLETAGVRVLDFGHLDPLSSSTGLQDLSSLLNRLPSELQDVDRYIRVLAQQHPRTAHLWLDEVNIKGGLAAVATGVPRIVLSGRNLPPNNFLLYQAYMREAYRWLLRQPGVILINNSHTGARAYEKWLGLPSDSIPVIHNGFDFDSMSVEAREERRGAYRKRLGIPDSVPVVGTVIRLNEEKRPLLWAEIATRIKRELPNAHFLVVGDGPLRQELEKRASQPDIRGHLHIVGLEKDSHVAMTAMDLFLLCSHGEGLPNVLVEAQYLGIPVVTTKAGGAPETLDHGRTGWVLGSDRPSTAAFEIVRLLQDKSWLEQAAAAAPRFVKSRFQIERMLDETLEIYGRMSKPQTLCKTSLTREFS